MRNPRLTAPRFHELPTTCVNPKATGAVTLALVVRHHER